MGAGRGEVERRYRRLARLAKVMDASVGVPLTRFRFGADSLLNVVPGLGTVAASGLSAYLIWEARQLGVPGHIQARMVANVAIDSAISLVPVVGWIGDAFYKSNMMNLALLREHLDRQADAIEGEVERTG